jgi:hypothetical protein
MDVKSIWLTFLFFLFFLVFIGANSNASWSVIVVLVHALLTLMCIFLFMNKQFIFLSAFIARLVFMFWDMYAKHIYVLPNSGIDSEVFFQQAVYFSQNIQGLFSYNGELYSKIIGVIFYFIGPQRIIGQYINVLIGLTIVTVIYRTLKMLNIDYRTTRIILLLAAFFPNSLIMSAIFLREIFPTFFITLSIYHYVKWIKTNSNLCVVLSFTFLVVASTFHSGIIGLSLGYFYGYYINRKSRNRISFRLKTFTSILSITLVLLFVFTYFEDSIFVKFRSIQSLEDIYIQASKSGEGGSGYLQNINVNNPLQLLLIGPVKSLFFIGSPLPFNWRGIMDVFTFFSDSLLYLYVFFSSYKIAKKFGQSKHIAMSLIFMIIGAIIIFGLGVSNAGTAIRHRQKLLPVFLVLLAVMLNKSNRHENTFLARDWSEKIE